MSDFLIKQPKIKNPQEIEELSFSTIIKEANSYSNFNNFSYEEQIILQRMIHTTTNFDNIIGNTLFTNNVITRAKEFLRNGASIIVDTNMIKAGISTLYTEKYKNNILCYVADKDVKSLSKEKGITRTAISVNKALNENKNNPVIIACGNAPTMLYAAIENIIKSNKPFSDIVILAMPVGFINVEESKSYTIEFLKEFNAEGIVLQGRYGGSSLIVSCLHAIYKLIK